VLKGLENIRDLRGARLREDDRPLLGVHQDCIFFFFVFSMMSDWRVMDECGVSDSLWSKRREGTKAGKRSAVEVGAGKMGRQGDRE